jgi:hypothetical protein
MKQYFDFSKLSSKIDSNIVDLCGSVTAVLMRSDAVFHAIKQLLQFQLDYYKKDVNSRNYNLAHFYLWV